VSLRVFAAEGLAGVRDWRLRVGDLSGPGADADLPMRVVLLPRGRTWRGRADLDGDGSPEWVIESQRVRLFSPGRMAADGWNSVEGHQLEFPARERAFSPGRARWRCAPRTIPWEFTARAGSALPDFRETTLTIEQKLHRLPADRPEASEKARRGDTDDCAAFGDAGDVYVELRGKARFARGAGAG